MSGKQHRLGVSENSLVVRHLKLEACGASAMAQVISEIDKIYGLEAVSFDENTRVLHIAYDAARICLECIESVLEKYDVEISHDWWTNFKEGYYRFFDQNIKDNMHSKPLGCHSTSASRR
ncbi:hypothetical protein P886_1796 [Alteromonadaceae bacterium 2753L.S.0a.02]|nr:hypothetical protein P886_1796 [Alteromonadaceae bacterium 2753L.S.0a.02]